MVMAHGIKALPWEDCSNKSNNSSVINAKIKTKKTIVKSEKTTTGTRRIFSPLFKLQVLDSYRQDADCQGNQRATARKYGIHRRQIQKWLQMESSLRCTVKANLISSDANTTALNLSPPRQCGATTREECTQSNMAASNSDVSEEEYVNVDEITDSEDSEEALDLSIKLKLNNSDFKNNLMDGVQDPSICRVSPPLWYLPPCCYPYSWNCCLPSPPHPPPSNTNIFIEKPLPRRQHLPLDFTNYTSLYNRLDNYQIYKIHSY